MAYLIVLACACMLLLCFCIYFCIQIDKKKSIVKEQQEHLTRLTEKLEEQTKEKVNTHSILSSGGLFKVRDYEKLSIFIDTRVSTARIDIYISCPQLSPYPLGIATLKKSDKYCSLNVFQAQSKNEIGIILLREIFLKIQNTLLVIDESCDITSLTPYIKSGDIKLVEEDGMKKVFSSKLLSLIA